MITALIRFLQFHKWQSITFTTIWLVTVNKERGKNLTTDESIQKATVLGPSSFCSDSFKGFRVVNESIRKIASALNHLSHHSSYFIKNCRVSVWVFTCFSSQINDLSFFVSFVVRFLNVFAVFIQYHQKVPKRLGICLRERKCDLGVTNIECR